MILTGTKEIKRMLPSLLDYSLERINSLQHFYHLENTHINQLSTEGMKRNCFGYYADRYFAMLTNPDWDENGEIENLKKRLENFIEISETDPENKAVIYRLKRADELRKKGFETDIKKASSKYRQFADMPIIHGSNTLIMLITRFEEFISNFLGELYTMFPKKYLDNQSVTFSELSSSNISDVKALIVSRQQDAIMRESYKEWFKIFSSHKLCFDWYKDELEMLEEIYARRNIVVHNSGCVNESYISQVKKSKYAIGETLEIDEDYLAKAFDAINILIFAIIIEAAKLISTDKREHLELIFDIAFVCLSDGKFTLCKKVFSALHNSKHLDNAHKTMSLVNYWISCIELDGLASVKKEIDDFDVSALDSSFDLAKCILLRDYDKALILLRKLYERKDIVADSLENWPLYRHFRESEQYATFKEEHAEDFNVVTFSLTAESSHENTDNAHKSDTESINDCECLSNNDTATQTKSLTTTA